MQGGGAAGDVVQAEDRAHRIGQASCVNVHYLHCKGMVDDIIWVSVANKLDNLGQVLNGCEDSLNASTTHAKARGQGTLDHYLVRARLLLFSAAYGDPSSAAESGERDECGAGRAQRSQQQRVRTGENAAPLWPLAEEDCFASPAKRARRGGSLGTGLSPAQPLVEVPSNPAPHPTGR
jgi:hypothetical protein